MSKEHERQPLPNREIELVRDYARVFFNRLDVYSVQQPRGHYLAVYQPLTLSLLQQHLQGQVTLGAYALSPDSRAKWVCFDADSNPQ